MKYSTPSKITLSLSTAPVNPSTGELRFNQESHGINPLNSLNPRSTDTDPYTNKIVQGCFRPEPSAPAPQPRELPRQKVPGWKSTLDLTLILLSLPLWLPVMLVLMLITRISSPGPIFYRQVRVGKDGCRFLMWKFRTMKVSSETRSHEKHLQELISNNRPMTKLDALGDPRVVPFGRVLRASGFDELPQIFNVLRGEMSLVGPRPCLPNEFASYQPWQRKRVEALPGLTGYWQVNGKNETTFNQMVAMDLSYVENMSVALDLKIILKTGRTIVGQVLESRG